ncbi:hypothetical protein AAE478_004094 [Parahypoxylon ruwenzoriense]
METAKPTSPTKPEEPAAKPTSSSTLNPVAPPWLPAPRAAPRPQVSLHPRRVPYPRLAPYPHHTSVIHLADARNYINCDILGMTNFPADPLPPYMIQSAYGELVKGTCTVVESHGPCDRALPRGMLIYTYRAWVHSGLGSRPYDLSRIVFAVLELRFRAFEVLWSTSLVYDFRISIMDMADCLSDLIGRMLRAEHTGSMDIEEFYRHEREAIKFLKELHRQGCRNGNWSPQPLNNVNWPALYFSS